MGRSMTPAYRVPRHALAALVLIGTASSQAAAGDAEMRQDSWRGCLRRHFALQASLTGRDLAADAAFHACRDAEDAYLAALSASPLLDIDDVARARPALSGRVRAWLVGNRATGG